MPIRTAAQTVISTRLLKTRLPSREMGVNIAPCRNCGARQAKSTKAPAVKNPMMPRMKMPRAGSTAKECTDVSTPDRTRKVPIKLSAKVMIASRIVQTFSASRFSITTAE